MLHGQNAPCTATGQVEQLLLPYRPVKLYRSVPVPPVPVPVPVPVGTGRYRYRSSSRVMLVIVVKSKESRVSSSVRSSSIERRAVVRRGRAVRMRGRYLNRYMTQPLALRNRTNPCVTADLTRFTFCHCCCCCVGPGGGASSPPPRRWWERPRPATRSSLIASVRRRNSDAFGPATGRPSRRNSTLSCGTVRWAKSATVFLRGGSSLAAEVKASSSNSSRSAAQPAERGEGRGGAHAHVRAMVGGGRIVGGACMVRGVHGARRLRHVGVAYSRR